MPLNMGKKLALGYGVLLVFLITFGIFFLVNLSGIVKQFSFLIENDASIVANAREMSKLVIDMETGQRSFIITGKEEFLEPYNKGANEFKKLIEKEKYLVRDNPGQIKTLEKIEGLVDKWQQKAVRPEIAIRKKINRNLIDAEYLQTLLSNGVGKGIMDNIRSVFDEMVANFRKTGNEDGVVLSISIAKDLIDMETGQRGFIITGKEKFLDPYLAGQKGLEEHISKLRNVLSGDARNMTLLAKIESLANDWFEKAAVPEINARREMNKHPETLKDVAALLEAGTGKKILDNIREEFKRFIKIEEDFTKNRYDNAASTASRVRILIIIFLIVSIIIGGTVSFFISRNIKQAEKALLVAEKKRRAWLENSPICTEIVDSDFNLQYISPAGVRGLHIDDITQHYGKPYPFCFYPESFKIQMTNNMRKAKEEGKVIEQEASVVDIEGNEIWYDSTIVPVNNGEGLFEYFLIVSIDTTERNLAEEALLKSEDRFRTIADFTYDWEYWISPDGQHIYVSPSCERITGYSAQEFMTDPGLFQKIVHPDDQVAVVNHIRQKEQQEKVSSYDFRIITRDEKERWINHVCQPVYRTDGGYLGQRASNRDISKRKIVQEELLKAKKLESIGILAGGIAHDFNNLMSAVVGNISLARIEMKPGSKAFKNLLEAEKASIQTKTLTARLITFSRGGEPVKETVSTGNLVKDSVESSLKGFDIDARFSIPDDISLTEADEDQIKQAIHNIVTNAQEAMSGQGTINISCENVNIGEKDTLTLKDGKYVRISVKDQGPGIPDEDLAKIFDPYFSTKDMGAQKGMGLGLSVSYSIVKKHDGMITVDSELGTGTTFSIYLPVSVKEIVEAAPEKKPVPEISLIQGGKILVMDDEKIIRDVSNALLTHLGYEVAVAVDGVEAIELYKKAMESKKFFDAVILDLTNKVGMGGAETMAKLIEIDPDVKAIVASGYSNDPIMSNFREHGFCGVLPKPFNLDQLKTALHDAVAGE